MAAFFIGRTKTSLALLRLDLRQVVAEGFTVHLPHRHKERGNNRADNKAENPEEAYAAKRSKKNQQLVHLGIAPDQHGTQDIVDLANHQRAEEQHP